MNKSSQKLKRNKVSDKLSNKSLIEVKSKKMIDSLDDDKLHGNEGIADISASRQHIIQMKKKKIQMKKKRTQMEKNSTQMEKNSTQMEKNSTQMGKKLKKVRFDVQDVQDAEDGIDEPANILTLHRQSKVKEKKKLKNKKQNLKKDKLLEMQDVQDAEDGIDDVSPLHRQFKEKEKMKIKKQTFRKALNLEIQAVQEASPKEMKKKKIKQKQQNFKNMEYLEKYDKLQNVTEEKVEATHPCSDDEVDQNTEKKTKSKGMLIQRSEASMNISEFHLNEIGKERVKVDELIKSLKATSSHLTVKNQLKNATKLKRLTVPLSKPQLEKIKRTAAYEKVCDQVGKWDHIVRSNRLADQIVFPLKKPEFRLDTIDKISESFMTKTPLEEEVSKLLNNSENVIHKDKPLTVAEEKALQAMSLDEAKARHGELMKHRALLSYKEAKARRQNKIKSKKYHRLLKKERLKMIVKEFETLQKVDPVAAHEKYIEADKLRILERMTLKHRNTGKWATQHKLRAKYNPESRNTLKEDLEIGRKLREKLPVLAQKPLENDVSDNEDSYFDSGQHINLIEDRRIEANLLEDYTGETDLVSNAINTNHFRHEEESDLAEKLNINNEDLQTAEMNTNESPLTVFKKLISNEKMSVQKPKAKPKEQKKEISIEKDIGFSTEVTFLKSMVPDDITAGDEGLDDVEGDTMNIRQAFADEGLIAEFREEKKAADEAKKPQAVDLLLPGWGSWGGPSVKPSERKRKRFLIQPVEPPTKKNSLGSVIINEDRDKKVASHQVSHLPYPFKNIHQFNSYIRQPVGNTWNPETSFQKLITPKVITRAGQIIDPLDSEDVILEKKEERHLPNKFVKNKFTEAPEAKAF